jgi:hypothetical protein
MNFVGNIRKLFSHLLSLLKYSRKHIYEIAENLHNIYSRKSIWKGTHEMQILERLTGLRKST